MLEFLRKSRNTGEMRGKPRQRIPGTRILIARVANRFRVLKRAELRRKNITVPVIVCKIGNKDGKNFIGSRYLSFPYFFRASSQLQIFF